MHIRDWSLFTGTRGAVKFSDFGPLKFCPRPRFCALRFYPPPPWHYKVYVGSRYQIHTSVTYGPTGNYPSSSALMIVYWHVAFEIFAKCCRRRVFLRVLHSNLAPSKCLHSNHPLICQTQEIPKNVYWEKSLAIEFQLFWAILGKQTTNVLLKFIQQIQLCYAEKYPTVFINTGM